MPFGPTNGPATFVTFIHDIDSVWKALAVSLGVPIGDTTNTRIIIDDIVSWAYEEDLALAYIRCQLRVCQAYRFNLNLLKSFFFEFSPLFGLFSNFPGFWFGELRVLPPKTLNIATTAATFPVLEFSIAISLAPWPTSTEPW